MVTSAVANLTMAPPGYDPRRRTLWQGQYQPLRQPVNSLVNPGASTYPTASVSQNLQYPTYEGQTIAQPPAYSFQPVEQRPDRLPDYQMADIPNAPNFRYQIGRYDVPDIALPNAPTMAMTPDEMRLRQSMMDEKSAQALREMNAQTQAGLAARGMRDPGIANLMAAPNAATLLQNRTTNMMQLEDLQRQLKESEFGMGAQRAGLETGLAQLASDAQNAWNEAALRGNQLDLERFMDEQGLQGQERDRFINYLMNQADLEQRGWSTEAGLQQNFDQMASSYGMEGWKNWNDLSQRERELVAHYGQSGMQMILDFSLRYGDLQRNLAGDWNQALLAAQRLRQEGRNADADRYLEYIKLELNRRQQQWQEYQDTIANDESSGDAYLEYLLRQEAIKQAKYNLTHPDYAE